jgi:hypothetical protein
MTLLRHGLLLTLAASALGCFDDAKLRPLDAGDDLAPSDIPVTPPDGESPDVAADAKAPDVADLDADVPAVDAADDMDDVAADFPRPDVPPGECPVDRVLVGTSDFRMGGYALGRFLPAPSLAPRMETSLDQDHSPVQSGCIVYDLLRSTDELAVLDPMSLPTPARRIPLRPAMGMSTDPYQANPYGVLTVSPTVAYVVLYNAPRVAVIDPTMNGLDAVRRTINLSPLRSAMDRDTSGAMEAAAIVRAGRYVFVALQNLNMFMPVTNGTLAVIDPTGDVLVDTDGATPDVDPVRLTGRNPYAMRVTPGGRLVVTESGALGPMMLDGGIEVVDPVSFAARGLRVTEAQLGGDVSDFVMLDDSRGWVIVRQSSTSSRVVEFDLDAAEGMRAGRTIVSSGDIAAIARDPSGNVWVLDRTAGRFGARVFNPMGTEVTSAPLGTGMYPPVGIAFVP